MRLAFLFRRPLEVLSLAVLTLGLFSGRAANAQTVINFPNFSGDPSTIHWAGTTSVMQYSGNVLEMTQNGVHNATNAYFTTPVNVQAFTTTFTFSVNCPTGGTNCGDGLGFIWVNPVTPLGNALGGAFWSGWSGAQFSWSSNCTTPSTGATNCTAVNAALVKFDLYDVQKGAPGAELTGYYTGGEWPQPPNPEYDMSGSGINMQSGDLFRATLAYDGTNLVETLTDTVTNATYTHTYAGVNIPAAVGGNTGIVGFGAGTGAATVGVNLDSWTYTVETPGAASTPTISPVAGTYSGTQNVTLSSATSGAVICYNTSGSPATNGSTGCTTGTAYGGPVTVSSSETLYAVAGGTGYADSSVGKASYVIQASVATPTFSPGAGTYSSAQSVTISDATSNATIYYATDGTTPTTSSTKYTSPITVSSAETLKAIAVATGDSNSVVASAAYTITALPAVATPAFSPGAGTYSSAQSVSISDATSGATIYYTTDGTTPTTSSTEYAVPITVSSTETLQAIAAAPGDTNSAVASAALTITPQLVEPGQAAAPTFSPAAGTYSATQSVTVSTASSGAVICYNTTGGPATNGASGCTTGTLYTGAVTVSSSETLYAVAGGTGYDDSPGGSASYVIQTSVATPTFSPGAGTYGSAQSVTISDAASGATIYYTTDGTTPTTSSTKYTGAITVSSTETLEAVAVAKGGTSSAVASAAYTITSLPFFTLGASPTSLTGTSSDQGTVTLTVTPGNGFDSTVTFACSGLPTGATCSFSPATVTPSGAPATTQLTISAAQSSALRPGSRPFFPLTALAMTVCLFGWRNRRGWHHWLLLTVISTGLGLLFGCSGTSGTLPTPTTPSPTATTSTVTVTAISGTVQGTATIKLTIN